MPYRLSPGERAFAVRVMRRRPLSIALSVVGVGVGIGVLGWAGYARLENPGAPLASHLVVAVLVLLNARRSLRESRHARVYEKLLTDEAET